MSSLVTDPSVPLPPTSFRAFAEEPRMQEDATSLPPSESKKILDKGLSHTLYGQGTSKKLHMC